MSIMSAIKARNAASKQAKGDVKGAMKLYQEAIVEGLSDPRYLLSYIVLLIRDGQYQSAREMMVKLQKTPLTSEQKITLFINYAACVYKMGELAKAIEVLESQHAKNPCGLIYQTLGYLYVEAGDFEKALAFNQEAIEYDDDDSIAWDNMAQAYYRLKNDKAKAKECFDKAHELKSTQLDTLYFLALYDLDSGNKEAAREKLETALGGRFSPLNYVTKARIEELLNTI